MKKNILLLCAICMSLFLLVACGTADETNDEKTPNDEANTEVENKNENEKNTDEMTNDEGNQSAQDEAKTITYDSKEQTITKETTLIEEETYTIEVAEGFEFTNEEPGKDLIFYKENDQISMRIEVVSVNDSTYEHIVTNTEELMAAINEQFESYDIQHYIEGNDTIEKAVAYKATYEEDEVIGVVYEKDDLIVRLTIFDQDEELKDALIQMGLTIKAK